MQDLANEIELKILSYFQKQKGFKLWWESLSTKVQGNIEQRIIDKTEDILQQADAADGQGPRCYHCGQVIKGKLVCENCVW